MHIYTYCHLLLNLSASSRALIWLVVCKLQNSHDKAVLTGVP